MVHLGLALSVSPAGAESDGIFADFETSMGSFTCRLDYAVAPKAVANFIGLATGEQAWVDPAAGAVRTNSFYVGLTFHKVSAGRLIESGSPNRQGTDGPGYVFPDEFNALLTHDTPGALSMSNTGPNSNGSQFFITATNLPQYDYVNTVFGQVIGGQTVVNAISLVATNAEGAPLSDVTIQSIDIRRIGAAANAFDIHAQGLPVVTRIPLAIDRTADGVSLTFSNRPFADNRLGTSTNLTGWSTVGLGIEGSQPGTNRLDLAATKPVEFFKMVQVEYPGSTFAPKTVQGGTLTLLFSDWITSLTITFDGNGGGVYDYEPYGDLGFVTYYEWVQEPYRGFLNPIEFSGLESLIIRLDFFSSLGGTFSASAVPPSFGTFVGTFSLSQP